MRRKRKSKYIWLPTLGAAPLDGGDLSQSNGFTVTATTDASGNANVPGSIVVIPILEDTPQEESTTANPDPNIADFIGTDYVIKRIVGKLFVTRAKIAANDYPTVAVTAGFFVARANDANSLLPIGATTNLQAIENYEPNFVDTIREPWIWRRQWLLSNPSSTNSDNTATLFGNFPLTNTTYPGVLDGPHIDAKTGRRIRNDERLWFALNVAGVTDDGTELSPKPSAQSTVSAYLDVRVLGALRKAKNRSNF